MYIDPDYLTYNGDDKSFMQRALFLEYLEDWEVSQFKGDPYSLLEELDRDLKELQDLEYYEVCQLYQDILHRFKKDIEEFDSK